MVVITSCVLLIGAPSDSVSFILLVKLVTLVARFDFRTKAANGVCTGNAHGSDAVYINVRFALLSEVARCVNLYSLRVFR